MQIIQDRRFGEERALYRLRDALVKNCRFEGEEDGESAFKECENIAAQNCYMDLRYPFWHARGLRFEHGEMTPNCRAAMWYDEDVVIRGSTLNGIKAVRECKNVRIEGTQIDSPEFGWRCTGISLKESSVHSQYAFFETRGLTAERLTLTGKYSFQYGRDIRIFRSELNTKDAFWHTKHAVVTDSVLNGEYLGWYSEELTLVRCHISGTQPLCYCKGLRLIDCTMENCDLAFEYSDVRARVRGGIASVKNPRRGKIEADAIGSVLRTEDSVYPVRAKLYAGGKAV